MDKDEANSRQTQRQGGEKRREGEGKREGEAEGKVGRKGERDRDRDRQTGTNAFTTETNISNTRFCLLPDGQSYANSHRPSLKFCHISLLSLCNLLGKICIRALQLFLGYSHSSS